MEDIKKRLTDFYDNDKTYGADKYSILTGQYGIKDGLIVDPTRYMVMYESQFREVLALVPSGRNILDVGTGDGVLAEYLCKNSEYLTAIDISIKRIKKCIEVCKKGYFVVGDAEDLPFKENSFDCLIATELIEHLIEPKKFLISSRYILKNGGSLIISTPSALIYENNIGEILKDQHLHVFSPRKLRRLLMETGFKVREIKGIGFKLRVTLPKIIAVMPRLFYALIKLKRPKRGFFAPVSVEYTLTANRYLNNLYFKDKQKFKSIFRMFNFIGTLFPSLASQVVVRAER